MRLDTPRMIACRLSILAIGCGLQVAHSATFDESVHGDLGSVAQSPTPWTLESGANPLTGTAGGDFFAGTSDYDLVSFTVPQAGRLDSIIVANYENVDEFSMSFLGLQAGSPWLDNLGWDIQGSWLLGWTHLQSSMEGVDVLEEIWSNSALPFQLPLPSGVYTLLIEDVDTEMSYSLIFNVSAVPEPATVGLLALGAAALGYWHRGRTRSAEQRVFDKTRKMRGEC
jgi:hypothetical protein